jgi:predicted TIM-barrel fold metal-dependent hydrolase
MTVIDADGHVEESPAMFNFLEKEYYARRPLALGFDRDTVYGPNNAVWFIDGKTYPKLVGKGGVRFVTPTIMESARRKPVSIPAQELTDVEARLRDLDRAGIDRQVVYPTLFLATTTDDIKLEAALFRAYNGFMADACSKSGGRIKFAAIVPIRDVEESIREMRRARGLGAVSVMLLGVAWDKSLGDKELYPFYEEAARLDIPVCIHFGWGCPAITDAFDSSKSFNSAVLPVLMGFHSVMSSGVLGAFSRLRFAFLETGSLWVPYVIHQLMRGSRASRNLTEYFREGRVYVACEADEDINYLVTHIGEDSLVVASDYPHSDFSREEQMQRAVMEREDVPLKVKEKILSANPQRLYGL